MRGGIYYEETEGVYTPYRYRNAFYKDDKVIYKSRIIMRQPSLNRT